MKKFLLMILSLFTYQTYSADDTVNLAVSIDHHSHLKDNPLKMRLRKRDTIESLILKFFEDHSVAAGNNIKVFTRINDNPIELYLNQTIEEVQIKYNRRDILIENPLIDVNCVLPNDIRFSIQCRLWDGLRAEDLKILNRIMDYLIRLRDDNLADRAIYDQIIRCHENRQLRFIHGEKEIDIYDTSPYKIEGLMDNPNITIEMMN